MTDEQINMTIAVACGWTEEIHGPSWYEYHTKMPNYCNDLNAMHEAEKACLTTIPLVTDYGIRLVNALHREHKKNQKIQNTSWCIPFVGNCGWFATAKQRAEAFLKTLNLWTELTYDRRKNEQHNEGQ